MARPTRYRNDHQLTVHADTVLGRYASQFGWRRQLPVPIEDIVERLYGIEIEWHDLHEPAGTSILGALDPAAKTILLNERHERLFSDVLGPYEFTLAHELGHWIFDADDPNQMNLLGGVDQRFCHSRNSAGMSQDQQRREWTANRFAATILLPADLVRLVDEDELVANLPHFAGLWNVSQQALRIRLETLGILDADDQETLW